MCMMHIAHSTAQCTLHTVHTVIPPPPSATAPPPLLISWTPGRPSHKVHTEWQRQLSGILVHSIMMEKLAQAGEDGGCMPLPTPFHYIYRDHLQYKVVVYAAAETTSTLPIFLLYYMDSVGLAYLCKTG